MKSQFCLIARPGFLTASLLLAASFACSTGAVEDVLTSHGQEGATVGALAIHPVVPTTLYAGTYFGVFKGTDGGLSWSAASTGLTDMHVFALVIDLQTPTTLCAGQWGRGVYKSTDGGDNWRATNTCLTATIP